MLSSLQTRDLAHVWHPCSQMKDYEDFPPIIIEKGRGVYLYDTDGKAYLDAVSSWWVNLFGHSNPRINKAIQDQTANLEHVIFANFSHRPAIELAEQITELAPEGLSRVFFADNGSSAVEAALKMSFQYHQQTGNPAKTRFISLTGAYHGETLGALSAGSLDLYSRVFKPLLLDIIKAPGPDCYRCPLGKNRDTCAAECFSAVEEIISSKAEEVCGIIIEPMVQAAAGMRIYPALYLKKLRESCSSNHIHLIADEIAVGFGRTGKLFASEHAGIRPDIMCLSKGLTAGYLPLSLVLTTDEIYQAFYSDYSELKAFMHSHSYSGNPISCRVALESLAIFKDENILETNLHKSGRMKELGQKIAEDCEFIGEYRQIGMIGAFELVENRPAKKPFDSGKRVGYQIYRIALEKGVILRPLGNVIYFMPPYVITQNEINHMFQAAHDSIKEFFPSK